MKDTSGRALIDLHWNIIGKPFSLKDDIEEPAIETAGDEGDTVQVNDGGVKKPREKTMTKHQHVSTGEVIEQCHHDTGQLWKRVKRVAENGLKPRSKNTSADEYEKLRKDYVRSR